MKSKGLGTDPFIIHQFEQEFWIALDDFVQSFVFSQVDRIRTNMPPFLVCRCNICNTN